MNHIDELANRLNLPATALRRAATNVSANAREIRCVQATVDTAVSKGKPALSGDEAIQMIETAINKLGVK